MDKLSRQSVGWQPICFSRRGASCNMVEKWSMWHHWRIVQSWPRSSSRRARADKRANDGGTKQVASGVVLSQGLRRKPEWATTRAENRGMPASQPAEIIGSATRWTDWVDQITSKRAEFPVSRCSQENASGSHRWRLTGRAGVITVATVFRAGIEL